MQTRILLAEDYDDTRERIGGVLERVGYEVLMARDGQEALDRLQAHRIDLIVSDYKMPGLDGLTLHQALCEQGRAIPLILYSAAAPSGVPFRAGREGVVAFLDYPFDVESQLVPTIRRSLGRLRTGRPGAAPENGSELIGDSEALAGVRRSIRRYAPASIIVLVTGETGTGKELVARALHASSPRARGPFVKVHCPALPASLIESELFGYEKGAFTGAFAKRHGRFEAASGGTLFLDEIGEVDLPIQVKLLQILQEGCFERIGGRETIRPDVRIVAATNRDLQRAVERGRFRRDLFYRLAQATIHIAPLRERLADMEPLARAFAREYAMRGQRPTPLLSESFVEVMKLQPWLGNVRELRATMQRALLWWDGERPLDALCFLQAFSATDGRLSAAERAQCQRMLQAYSKAGGNQEQARRALGMTRAQWRHRWVHKFGFKLLGRGSR